MRYTNIYRLPNNAILQVGATLAEEGLSDSESAYSLGDSLDDLEEVIPLSQKSADSPPPLLEVDESLPASATDLLYEELSKKTKLLRIAVQEAHQFRRSYEKLSAKIKSKKKRSRDEPSVSATPEAEATPKKRPSPDPPVEPTARTAGDPSSKSDDEVALPAPVDASAKNPRPKSNNKPFEELNSILCAYKDKKIRPGSTNLPFEICVELCNEEIERVEKDWGPAERTRFHKPILSALRLVYPNKRKEWFGSPFLLDPTTAAQYWVKVLTRRSEIWEAAAKKLASSASRSATSQLTLEQRIRQKIMHRKNDRILSLRAAAKAAGSSNPYKTPPRRPSNGLSSSDSEHEVVDLSRSPAEASASSKSRSSLKMARAPGCVNACALQRQHLTALPPLTLRRYTLPEMKSFKRMAKAIRNVNERDGHAESTAAFIDAEFSDNSGMTLKALRSKVAWKKNRVNAICDKAARIMEDR